MQPLFYDQHKITSHGIFHYLYSADLSESFLNQLCQCLSALNILSIAFPRWNSVFAPHYLYRDSLTLIMELILLLQSRLTIMSYSNNDEKLVFIKTQISILSHLFSELFSCFSLYVFVHDHFCETLLKFPFFQYSLMGYLKFLHSTSKLKMKD